MRGLVLLSFLCLSLRSSSALAIERYAGFETTDALLYGRSDDIITPAPDCSKECLETYIPIYCDTMTNTTCICTDQSLKTSVSTCANAACNITDILQLTLYNAKSCGVKNDKSKLHETLLVDYTLPFITTLFVGGRTYARIKLDVGLGYDDWVMISAYFAYIITVGTSLGMVVNGFGEHVFWLSIGQVIDALKFFFVTELFYMIAVTLTKLSLLLFFLRIFPSQRLRTFSWWFGGFIVLTNLCIMIALCFQCIPFHGYWTNWMIKENKVKCINQFAALNAAAGLGIFHNFVILVLPIPTLLDLNLPWQKKLNLLCMFSIGSFVVICSCLRLPSLKKLEGSSDLSFDQAPIILFSHLEESVGLICACLPACRSLVEYFIPSLKSSSTVGRTNGGTGMPRSKHQSRLDATSARSFIELGDREGTSTPPEGGSHLTLQEVLDGAPAKARKGGCNGGGGCSKFGHETRVVGGAGNELPPSKHVRGTELQGSRSGSLSLIPSNIDEKQSDKGVIIMTKTVEHIHEDMPQQNLSWLELKHG